ncbi:MAG TPA: response regulator [Parafilimonas sp.]|nr:response regulator [Parafilimonas sp.]
MLIVFIIDDDLDDQEIFSIVMREITNNIQCVFANDGVLALEKIKSNPSFIPALIFIDINMPKMSGVQCLSEIKKIKHLQNVPIYMYSTAAEKVIVEQCKKYGATGFIKKHIDTNDLKAELEKIISCLKH